MSQMQTQLNNTNKNGGNDNITSGKKQEQQGPILETIILLDSWCIQSPGEPLLRQGKRQQIKC